MQFLQQLSELGGFAGLAALIPALIQLRGIRKDTAKTRAEVSPNHGSSTKDAVYRVEYNQAQMFDQLKSLGHQIGEIKRDASVTHEMLADQLADHSERLRKIEQRK